MAGSHDLTAKANRHTNIRKVDPKKNARVLALEKSTNNNGERNEIVHSIIQMN